MRIVKSLAFAAFLGGIYLSTVVGGEGPCPEGEPTLYLDTPGAENGRLTGVLYLGQELEVMVRLGSAPEVAQGFWLSVTHDAQFLTITDLTLAGTDTEKVADNSFYSAHEPVSNESGTGFIAAVVLSLKRGNHYPPGADSSLLRARYRVSDDAPPTGEGEKFMATAISFQDGLEYDPGQPYPYENVLSNRGETLRPCTESLTLDVELLPEPAFARGDANLDGVIDISDPSALLWTLFIGPREVRCDDAADANDDGRLEISDAIYTFNYLFRGTAPPRMPFPLPGTDPTEDGLHCRP